MEEAPQEVRKSLKNGSWYGIVPFEDVNDFFVNERKKSNELLKNIKEKQIFAKKFYEYQGKQIFIGSIVGKNGSGKSSLLNIFHIIINNFAAEIKNKFSEYNKGYEIEKVSGIKTKLFYENNGLIYSIKIDNNIVEFSNNEARDLFSRIKNLSDLSEHIFYTISTNFTLYAENPSWLENLYHKNDGYFTPIVLVPFRNSNIDSWKENNLAEKRVQILALLLYKEKKEFIENYIPYKIEYELKDIKDYKKIIDEKLKNLQQNVQFTQIHTESREQSLVINTEIFDNLKTEIENYWDNFFKSRDSLPYSLSEYIKKYAIYKTLKSCVNYETIYSKLDFGDLKTSLETVINDELWDERHINYINLKLLTCKRFMEYSFANVYDSKDKNSFRIDTLLDNKEIQAAISYDQLYILSLPDFFDVKFYYCNNEEYIKKPNKDNLDKIQLSQMSSGERQLYNSLSYVVYHIKNAQSNKNTNTQDRIPYKNFNLVFDEAELYYHPEYQRCYIRNLVQLINRCNLNINGINITLVTHSPFILSDISHENILALENGNSSQKITKTLGANIYDLLQNQFFMNSSIGECSKIIIERIIDYCNSDKKLTLEEVKAYETFIDCLGDEYLATSLREMLNEKKGVSFYDEMIDYHRRKLEQLKTFKKEGLNE